MSTVPLGRAPGEDPAVLSWRIALAPRPRYLSGGHWWRDLVTRTYQEARDARAALRESSHLATGAIAGTANSDAAWHQVSDEEFALAIPPLTFRDVLVGLSGGGIEPGPW